MQFGDPEYLLLYDLDADGMVMDSDVDLASAQLGGGCSLVDAQVIQATLATLPYRDLYVALADGYVQATQSIAGHGIHYLNASRMSDNVFDPARPDGLNYSEDGRLLAVFYVVPMWVPGNELAPEGFNGSEDMWHYHDGLCQWQTYSGPMVAENVPQSECLARPGGVWFRQFGWMLHLWNYQHNPMGRFAMENPDLGGGGHLMDSDGDGCPDSKEQGSDPGSGGDRNPLDGWDFYDVPAPALRLNPFGTRDGGIGVTTDVVALLAYSGLAAGHPDYDGDYDADGVADGLQYDRSPSADWSRPWQSGPPDGGIGVTTDVVAMLAQAGHSCAAPP